MLRLTPFQISVYFSPWQRFASTHQDAPIVSAFGQFDGHRLVPPNQPDAANRGFAFQFGFLAHKVLGDSPGR